MAELDDLLKQAGTMGIALTGRETETEVKTLIEAPHGAEQKKAHVIATVRGALPVTGLVEPGARFEIDPALFSDVWMKPADAASAKLIKPKAGAKG